MVCPPFPLLVLGEGRLIRGYIGTVHSFQPKLVLTIDAINGIPLDLNLSQDTRRSLENLVRKELGSGKIETENLALKAGAEICKRYVS